MFAVAPTHMKRRKCNVLTPPYKSSPYMTQMQIFMACYEPKGYDNAVTNPT